MEIRSAVTKAAFVSKHDFELGVLIIPLYDKGYERKEKTSLERHCERHPSGCRYLFLRTRCTGFQLLRTRCTGFQRAFLYPLFKQLHSVHSAGQTDYGLLSLRHPVSVDQLLQQARFFDYRRRRHFHCAVLV